MCPIDSDLKERTVMQRLILGMVEIHGNSEMMWFRPIFKDQIKHQKKNGLHVSQELHLGSSGSTGSTESEGNWGEESSSWPAMGEQTEQTSFDLENLEWRNYRI